MIDDFNDVRNLDYAYKVTGVSPESKEFEELIKFLPTLDINQLSQLCAYPLRAIEMALDYCKINKINFYEVRMYLNNLCALNNWPFDRIFAEFLSNYLSNDDNFSYNYNLKQAIDQSKKLKQSNLLTKAVPAIISLKKYEQ